MKRIVLLALLTGGCATASPVMDLGDGSYAISAQAAPVRGGATGATTYAFEKAQAYCAPSRAVLVHANERDLQQGSMGWYGGSGGGGIYNAGGANIRFRCGKPSQ
jgi:hypothetical protein